MLDRDKDDDDDSAEDDDRERPERTTSNGKDVSLLGGTKFHPKLPSIPKNLNFMT